MITLKGKVHYVGVNDRIKTLFEGLWPLPYGVTYNSYLIADEKIALIDTVDANYFDLFLDKSRRSLATAPSTTWSSITWSPTIPVPSVCSANSIRN